ncbi:ankyrin repeat domain-containing protein, partial [Rickettsiales bacterium]|nr:ankyrin repeat domain-containing protein [Rickettsiales bacterium]
EEARKTETLKNRTRFYKKNEDFKPIKDNSDKYGNRYNKDGRAIIENDQLKHSEAHLLSNILDIQHIAFLSDNNFTEDEKHYAFLEAQNYWKEINKTRQSILEAGEESKNFKDLVIYEKEKIKFLFEELQYFKRQLEGLDDQDLLKNNLILYFDKHNSLREFDHENTENQNIFKEKKKGELEKIIKNNLEHLEKKLQGLSIGNQFQEELDAVKNGNLSIWKVKKKIDETDTEITKKITEYVKTKLETEISLKQYNPVFSRSEESSQDLFIDIIEEDIRTRFNDAKSYFTSLNAEGRKNTIQKLLIKQIDLEQVKEIFSENHLKECINNLSNDEIFNLFDIKNDSYLKSIIDLISADKMGAIKNYTNKDGLTPLHIAVHNNCVTVVDKLIEAGADKDKGDKNKLSPLHIAAHNNYATIVDRLIEAGADKDKDDKNNNTPLHLAAFNGHTEVVKKLIEAGADKDKINKDQESSLHLAAYSGHIAIVEELIKAGADKDRGDKNGDTPLHIAAYKGHTEVIEKLIKAGANKDKCNKNRFTALHMAAYSGHTKIVEKLIEAGANKDAVNKDGNTPIHMAAYSGHTKIVEKLIEAGANKDAVNKDGNTPIHMAAFHGRVEIIKKLIESEIGQNECESLIQDILALHNVHAEAKKSIDKGLMKQMLKCNNHEDRERCIDKAKSKIGKPSTSTRVISFFRCFRKEGERER